MEKYEDILTIDTHNDTMLMVIDKETWLPVNNIGNLLPEAQLDIPKMKDGGLNVAFFSSYTGGYTQTGRSNSRLLALMNALHWTKRMNLDSFGLARSASEIEELIGQGKSVGLPTIEGAYSLENYNALELLKQYYDLGIRAMALCWSNSNSLGEGVNEKYVDGNPSQGGLSELGLKVIEEMNRLGMVVDVSHMNERTFWDTIKACKAPIMASHSNARSLFDHPRNLTDEQIQAIADSGGVVQQNFYAGFLGPKEDRKLKKLVDHIDYVVNLVGIDHVGLGSDFDGGGMPEDLPNASFYYRLLEELENRGYSKADIEKIAGKNTLRVMAKVESLAENPLEKADFQILPNIEMGGKVSGFTPLFKAKIENLDGSSEEAKFRLIVDGKVYTSLNVVNEELSLQINEPLVEKFHVVTFEGTSGDKIIRETRIFYIED